MRDIINQVKSPFTDEMVKKLIKQYISWNEDFSSFCRKINGIDSFENITNLFLEYVNEELMRKNKIVKNNSRSWNSVISEKNYLRKRKTGEQNTGLYKIYLNVKGQDKAKVVEEYVQQCEAREKGYKFKYAIQDGRHDEIIITTDSENLRVDIEIVQQIIEGVQVGKLPPLIGIYKNEIGIAEEYEDAPIYSYTESRLDMIPKAIAKYIFDNSVEFIEYCNARQVKVIADTSKFFKEDGNNIALGQIGYGMHIVVVKELIEPLRQYMEDNSQKALPEMILNFRIVCQSHGISEKGVFSISTEQEVGELQNGETTEEKTLEELQNELERLVKQEKRTSQKRDETRILRNAYQAELAEYEKG